MSHTWNSKTKLFELVFSERKDAKTATPDDVNAFQYTIYVKPKKIRLIGISLSGLIKSYHNNSDNEIQTELFTQPQKSEKLIKTIDLLKNIYGEEIVFRAAYLNML